MADNYLENKMEALQARKAKEQRAREIAWKKRLDAYRKKMQAANEAAVADCVAFTASFTPKTTENQQLKYRRFCALYKAALEIGNIE